MLVSKGLWPPAELTEAEGRVLVDELQVTLQELRQALQEGESIK